VNTPRFLLAAAAMFWGWQTGFWVPGIAAALVLELANFVTRRFEVEVQRQRRIADLCVVLAAMVGTGCYVAYGNPRAIVLLFQWLPLILLPLALLQAWGGEPGVRFDVLFWGLRRDPEAARRTVNLGYPMLLVWLIGAAAANQRGEAFSAGVAVLGAWALWSARRDRSRPLLWAVLVGVAFGLGSLLHVGLNGTQTWLEGAAPDWMTGSGGTRTNPYRASTDMGSIGDLKQSDEIILRVKMEPPLTAGLLLHRASYNEYGGASWLARDSRFTEIARTQVGAPWMLRTGAAARFVEVAEQAMHGNPVLSLPAGAVSVQGDAISLKASTLGAVQAEAAPGFVIYRVGVGDLPVGMAEPGGHDLKIPAREKLALEQAATEFGLVGLPPDQVVQALRRGFAEKFRYATSLHAPREGKTALAEFLLSHRAGHCEYFASATVLLLRMAGVPARYATGFSVQEQDAASGSWLVRERHAHAWARAWVGGAWVDIDTTPPDWAQAEDLARPGGQRLRTWFIDAWSSLRYRYAVWQRDSSEWEKWRLFGGVGALVLAWLAWRVFGGKRQQPVPQRAEGIQSAGAEADVKGRDSPFYAVEAKLAAEGLGRAERESIGEWVERVTRNDDVLARELKGLAGLHYRYRFDPIGSSIEQRQVLDQACGIWLNNRAAAGATA
jgi:hypothetical protein